MHPGDPIFNGVNVAGLSYFHNVNFAHPGLDAGASLIATDGIGNDMIARNAAGNIIGLNLFPGNNVLGNNGAFYDLLANSLQFGSSSVPEAANTAILLLLGGCAIFIARKLVAPSANKGDISPHLHRSLKNIVVHNPTCRIEYPQTLNSNWQALGSDTAEALG